MGEPPTFMRFGKGIEPGLDALPGRQPSEQLPLGSQGQVEVVAKDVVDELVLDIEVQVELTLPRAAGSEDASMLAPVTPR